MPDSAAAEPIRPGFIIIDYRRGLLIGIGLILGTLLLAVVWMIVFWKIDQTAIKIDLVREERLAAINEMVAQINEIEAKIIDVHAELAKVAASLSRVTGIVDKSHADMDASSDKLDKLRGDVDKLLEGHRRLR